MSPEECIAALDAGLAENGEDVILRRVVGQAPNTVNVDVVCRANVKTWRLKEELLAAGIAQAVVIVVISPSQIAAAQWPGGQPPQAVDPSLPKRLDKIQIGGRWREIEAVNASPVGGQVVRIEMQVLG